MRLGKDYILWLLCLFFLNIIGCKTVPIQNSISGVGSIVNVDDIARQLKVKLDKSVSGVFSKGGIVRFRLMDMTYTIDGTIIGKERTEITIDFLGAQSDWKVIMSHLKRGKRCDIEQRYCCRTQITD